MRIRRSLAGATAALLVALAVPLSAMAGNIPVAAEVYLVKQDNNAGYVGKLAKIVSKPLGKFPLPATAPTAVGATLKFYKVGTPGTWEDLVLPAAQWVGIAGGAKGFLYRGAGSLTDPCKTVSVRKEVIKAICRGPNSTDSPSPFSLPVATAGAAWELVIGGDRYCAWASSLGGQVKKNDAAKGVFKAVKSAAGCFNAMGPTPTPNPTLTPTPTPPYGSASKAFL